MTDQATHSDTPAQGILARLVHGASKVDSNPERRALFQFIQGILTAIAVILLLASLSRAHGESYSFHSYQKQDGLENLNIHAMLQDRNGLLWLSTENGLYTSDGARISRVTTYEGREIPYITAINEDGAGRIWISSYHELLFHDATGVHRPGLPRFDGQKQSNTAIASFPDEADRIFFVADQTLMRVSTRDRGATWQQAPLFSPGQLAAHPELNSLDSVLSIGGEPGRPGSHVLWLSCANKLCEVSPDDGSVQIWGPNEGVPDDEWDNILRDHWGRLWARGFKHLISLPDGATRFVPEQGPLTEKSIGLRLPAMAEDPQGRIVMNVNDGLARREADGKWRVFGSENGLPAHQAISLLFDRQGAFWFSLQGFGLERWLGYDNWESWTTRNGLGVGAVWGLGQDHRGTMWALTELDLHRLASVNDEWRPLDPGHSFRRAQAILVDTRGHIWIGLNTGAVLDYDPATNRTRKIDHITGSYNFFQDPAGSIWICGTKALYRLDPADGYTKLQTTVHGLSFPTGRFFEMKAAPNKNLYFVGEKGLFELRPSSSGGLTQIALPTGASIPKDSPFSIAKDGTLWMQGESSPVIHLRVQGSSAAPTAQLIEHIDPPYVASPAVYLIATDHRGWLWVGSDKGVDVFNGHQWVGLTTEDGLVWDDTDTDSFHESPDGSIWIGTSGGLSHIRNPELIFRQEPFALLINNAQLGTSPVLISGSTKIPWARRGALTMALGTSAPGRAAMVHYRYRLEGSENEWQETDEPMVRYSALPPGRYRLAVVAIDTRRHQESAPVYVTFRLMPPWWRTTWFLCGLAVLIAALVGLASWWRVSALIAQQQRLEELVRERTFQLELEKKELIEARMALTEQASRDGLTGLLNRSAIFEILSNEIQYASEKNTSLAIVLADLDHFKRINDTYGHQIGDAVLRECARRFRQATRPTDYVGRYGGEELLLILPGLSQDNSIDRLENLRATIAHELFDCEGIGLPVTCSFGVAWLDEQSRGIKPLIALADQALYAAKTRGRNRVETITSASSGLFFPDGSGPLLTV